MFETIIILWVRVYSLFGFQLRKLPTILTFTVYDVKKNLKFLTERIWTRNNNLEATVKYSFFPVFSKIRLHFPCPRGIRNYNFVLLFGCHFLTVRCIGNQIRIRIWSEKNPDPPLNPESDCILILVRFTFSVANCRGLCLSPKPCTNSFSLPKRLYFYNF